jgi:hypothetical protein
VLEVCADNLHVIHLDQDECFDARSAETAMERCTR